MRLHLALAAASLWVAACGAPDAGTTTELADDLVAEPVSEDEAILERCRELNEMLLVAERTPNDDTAVTAYYAIREHYDECQAALVRARPTGLDREVTSCVIDLMMLGATHMATQVYYADDQIERTCELAMEGNDYVTRLRQRLADIVAVYGYDEGGNLAGIEELVVRESRFFGFAAAMICATIESPEESDDPE